MFHQRRIFSINKLSSIAISLKLPGKYTILGSNSPSYHLSHGTQAEHRWGKNDIAGEVVCNKIHKNQPHLGHRPWPAIFSIILHADILNIFHSIQTSDHPPNSPTFHVTHDRWFYFFFTEQNRSHHMDALPLPNTKHSSVPGSTPMLSSFFLTNGEKCSLHMKVHFLHRCSWSQPFLFPKKWMISVFHISSLLALDAILPKEHKQANLSHQLLACPFLHCQNCGRTTLSLLSLLWCTLKPNFSLKYH